MTMDVVTELKTCNIFIGLKPFDELTEEVVEKILRNLRLIILLFGKETFLSNINELLGNFFALAVDLFALGDLVVFKEFVLAQAGLVDFGLVFLAICFKEFIALEFGVDLSDFVFFSLLVFLQSPIFLDDFYVLPCSPDLVLQLLFLLGSLLDSG